MAIHIEENISLKPFTTFGIDQKTRYFVRVGAVEEFQELITSAVYQDNAVFLLGGGSNLLFTKDFDGLIVKDELKGITIVGESDDHIHLKVAAGENWHELVRYCVHNNFGGIENLSLIPGTMGAAPIQNIGAYGVEIKEVVKEVEVVDRKSGEVSTFTNQQCEFAYRESIFKQKWKEIFFISSVTLTLTKKNHVMNISYGAIQDTLKQMNVIQPTLQSISDAVTYIRQRKLPDPQQIGNAGSFFKNPIISFQQYTDLKIKYPEIPAYTSGNQLVKVPAGWLIEQCNWKGKRFNDAGVHAHQSLVLVNYGNASGEEVLQLSWKIKSSVKKKFNIDLITEVNII